MSTTKKKTVPVKKNKIKIEDLPIDSSEFSEEEKSQKIDTIPPPSSPPPSETPEISENISYLTTLQNAVDIIPSPTQESVSQLPTPVPVKSTRGRKSASSTSAAVAGTTKKKTTTATVKKITTTGDQTQLDIPEIDEILEEQTKTGRKKKETKAPMTDIDIFEHEAAAVREQLANGAKIEDLEIPQPPQARMVIDQKIFKTVQSIAHSHATRLISYAAQILKQDEVKMLEKYVCPEEEIIEITGKVARTTEKRPPPIMPERCCARIWQSGRRVRCTKGRCVDHVGHPTQYCKTHWALSYTPLGLQFGIWDQPIVLTDREQKRIIGLKGSTTRYRAMALPYEGAIAYYDPLTRGIFRDTDGRLVHVGSWMGSNGVITAVKGLFYNPDLLRVDQELTAKELNSRQAIADASKCYEPDANRSDNDYDEASPQTNSPRYSITKRRGGGGGANSRKSASLPPPVLTTPPQPIQSSMTVFTRPKMTLTEDDAHEIDSIARTFAQNTDETANITMSGAGFAPSVIENTGRDQTRSPIPDEDELVVSEEQLKATMRSLKKQMKQNGIDTGFIDISSNDESSGSSSRKSKSKSK